MDIAKELEEPYEDIDKLIDHMDLEVALGNRKLENRMEGIMRTRLLFDRVNEALTVLSHKPDNGKRLYDVIYHTYIRPDIGIQGCNQGKACQNRKHHTESQKH